MEPSQELASEGEFKGTESGWTTYIGSPLYNEGSNDDDDDEQSVDIEDHGNNYKNAHEHTENKGEKNNNESNRDTDEESDDSMASDAASGPSHLQFLCINSEVSHGLDFTEHTENENEKIPLVKRATKQERKARYEGMVVKEEGSLLVADSAASHV
ncbi:suppressor of Mek1-like [Abrus precatorius]|uniref:Suppressor of Mek1-like n=1 Tax=Abrus precatorius TaxID=3816 RepID=A0A8B8M467_ABRPR|nr:suppressor of Mek1-like [Abrus precatorius]